MHKNWKNISKVVTENQRLACYKCLTWQMQLVQKMYIEKESTCVYYSLF